MPVFAVPIVFWYFFHESWLHLKCGPFHHCTVVASEFGSLYSNLVGWEEVCICERFNMF